MKSEFKFYDRDGDSLEVDFETGDDPVLTVSSSTDSTSVYLKTDDARALRDTLNEFLDEGRPADAVEDAKVLLIQAAKDLLRKAAPEGAGDLVVFLEPS